LSVSSQGEAFTPVDTDGNMLYNAMVSSDTRAKELSVSWSRNFGEEKIYHITGHTPHPLFSLYKILWIKENLPTIWKKTHQFLCFEDLFQLKVGIKPGISWSLAGRTMLFDVVRHQWSPEILAGIELSLSQLATPKPSGEIAGYIDEITGKKLGFKNRVMVVTGGHDQTCAALGAGITKPGLCMYATGTVECFCPMLEKPAFTDDLRHNNLCCYDFTIPGKYTTVAYSLTGGNILRWMRDELGHEEMTDSLQSGENAYSLLLKQMPEEPTDLLVLPYFTPTGTPHFDTQAKGAILGLQLTTKKEEITKGLLEGVAMEMKLNLELMEQSGMKIDSFVATGGGTRNQQWTQLKADVLNKPIVTRNVNEAGCYGAAMLAASAYTGQPVEVLIQRNQIESKITQPDPVKVAIYEAKFKKYKQLYPLLKLFWKE
jgi:xylulokinase